MLPVEIHHLAVVSLRDDFSTAAAQYPERGLVRSDVLDVGCTGNLAFRHDLTVANGHGLLFAELLILPLALLVLLVVFRSTAAAALSVGIGALAVTHRALGDKFIPGCAE